MIGAVSVQTSVDLCVSVVMLVAQDSTTEAQEFHRELHRELAEETDHGTTNDLR